MEVILPSGNALPIDAEDGTTLQEVRAQASRALLVSQRRLILVDAEGAVLEVDGPDAETRRLAADAASPIMVTIGEGQEFAESAAALGQWFRVVEVPYAAELPEGATECSLYFALDAIQLKSMELYEKKFDSIPTSLDDSVDEVPDKEDPMYGWHMLVKDLAARLEGGEKASAYWRWQDDVEGADRIYGITAAYSSVEILRVCGKPLEVRGEFTKDALNFLFFGHEFDEPPDLVKTLQSLHKTVADARQGDKNAQWVLADVSAVTKVLKKAFKHAVQTSRANSTERFAGRLELVYNLCVSLADSLPALEQPMLETLLQLSDCRDVDNRIECTLLLLQHHRGNACATQRLQERCEADWPCVRHYFHRLLSSPPSEPEKKVAVPAETEQLATPRASLIMSCFRGITHSEDYMTRPSKKRKGKKGKSKFNMFWRVGDEEEE
eukprot:TRINITY_DN15583_c0_g1_i1.p1 TRINITY_DN15583_c0_g1~~TRINITY_DN15583_c0_g1_i1.p1  ORF type:complete len:438 (-),score=67.11 TRINITY_DN15583_c0_g1_i1:272-1585(-)